MKKCPYCSEEIQDEAIKCKHCGEMINQQKNPNESGKEAIAGDQDYKLGKPLSIWNVQKVKNPENYGGYKKVTFSLLSLLSLACWVAGLILFIITRSSESKLKRVQGKIFLLGTIIGFIFCMFYVFGN